MTTQDVIKLLPIDETIKMQVLKMYDYMDPAQKLAIQRIAWNTYDFMSAQQVDDMVELQLDKVREGDGKLGIDFYDTALKHADQQIQKELQESSGAVDLATARQSMEQIIREMQEAKPAKKSPKVQ
ncbi:MAG TPA: hypothetical protein VE090_03785 [Methylomirabilota bacterium]|nr:hypothetical protein [Methylomirabilota bacterium]